MAAPEQWGNTPPISKALPTREDLELNESMLQELKAQNNFESTEATQRRQQVLKKLGEVTLAFVRYVGKKKGLAQSVIENGGGKLSTFGSYRLGVYGPGSDIDALVLGPKHVTRNDFFNHFPDILKQMSSPEAIEEMILVPDSSVPIIKLEYSGVSIDLIYSHLEKSCVPENIDLRDDRLLEGLEEVDRRSMNGTRVADEMLSLIPQTKTFRGALRTIKLWAQRRAIYANIVGFPGGIAWALMVARVCQLYPYACGATIALKFFGLMAGWRWPQAVSLKTITDHNPLNANVWNPDANRHDRRHIMPIITPAYPAMCATHNVTHSTFAVINKELKRAQGIATDIMEGKKMWKDLFARHTFFSNGYKYYLSIVSASRTNDAQLIWSGFVQSKVRHLVAGIENSESKVAVAHPFTKGFDRVHRTRSEEEIEKVLQGSLDLQISETTTTEEANIKQQAAAKDGGESAKMPSTNGVEKTTDGSRLIYSTTFYVGLDVPETSDGSKKSLDISFPVKDFREICFGWKQYDEELNSLRVIHTRDYDLPADVFDPGEARPQRKKKLKKINRPPVNKNLVPPQPTVGKRKSGEAGLQERESKRRESGTGKPLPTPAAAG